MNRSTCTATSITLSIPLIRFHFQIFQLRPLWKLRLFIENIATMLLYYSMFIFFCVCVFFYRRINCKANHLKMWSWLTFIIIDKLSDGYCLRSVFGKQMTIPKKKKQCDENTHTHTVNCHFLLICRIAAWY